MRGYLFVAVGTLLTIAFTAFERRVFKIAKVKKKAKLIRFVLTLLFIACISLITIPIVFLTYGR